MQELLTSIPVLGVFGVILAGLMLGKIKVRGLHLGASGVLFAALLAGHFGIKVPQVLQDFGLILFVLSVGLQAGPRFFQVLRKKGAAFSTLAFAIVISGAVLAFAFGRIFQLPSGLIIGLMTGALTSTPGLAAAIEATGDAAASVGYGIAYPFGVAAVVLFVQLVPTITDKELGESSKYEEKDIHPTSEPDDEEGLLSKTFIVENPDVHRKMLDELAYDENADVTVSRIFRDGRSFIGRDDSVVLLDDKIVIVGRPSEMEKMGDFFGTSIDFDPDIDGGATVKRVIMNRTDLEDRALKDLNLTANYGVLLTRIKRGGIEVFAQPETTLELGDVCTLVGTESELSDVEELFQAENLKVTEIDMFSLSAYVVIGSLLGTVPIPIPGVGNLTLGFAGGPLFVGLIASYLGGLGPLRGRFRSSGLNAVNRLGLTVFLLGAGTSAGTDLVEVLSAHGLRVFWLGAIMTLVPMLIAYGLANFVFKLNAIYTLGSICGGMTSTPGLGALNDVADSEEPTVAYAAVYPLALTLVAISAQLLAHFL